MIADRAPIDVDLAHADPFELGPLLVRPSTRELVVGDRRQVLEPRVMQVLVALASRRGEVVSRDDLIAACWRARTVVGAALTRCIVGIRRLARDHGGFTITTVARVGYRLDEAVKDLDAATPPSVPVLAKHAPLVGRDEERAALRGRLGEALAGGGAMALLGGESGIGKSRLAEEIGLEAARRGALVLTGYCYETAGAMAYGPFVEILERSARVLPPETFRQALGEDAAQVAKIMPELHPRFANMRPAIDLPPEQERRRLHNGLRDFFDRMSRQRPLVLVIEDLHWADEASLGLLHHLAEQLGEMPMLILGTHRDAEREIGRPFADFLEQNLRRRLSERLSLRGLTPADTAELISALAGQPFARARMVGPDEPPGWVRAVHKATQGNPFFIEEVVRRLAEEGRLFDHKGRLRSDIAVAELGVPESVRLVLGRRLARLSETGREVLTAAAVIGTRFDVHLLEALHVAEPDAVLTALDEAEAAALVAAEAAGYRFAHDLVRQAIIHGLPPGRRQRLQSRIAEAMERTCVAACDDHVADLGRHLSGAGSHADPAKTAHYLLLAGARALESYAYEEALGHFQSGLAVAPAEAASERARLYFGRARCHRGLDRGAEAVDGFRTALAIYERLGETGLAAEACRWLADQVYRAFQIREAIEICQQGLAMLGDRRCGERARLLGMLGYFLCVVRQYEPGESLLGQADDLANQLGEPAVAANVCDLRAMLHGDLGESRQALPLALRAAREAREAGDEELAAGALTRAAGALYLMARWEEAGKLLNEAEPLADQARNTLAWKVCQRMRGAMIGLKRGVFYDENDKEFLQSQTEDQLFGADAFVELGTNAYIRGRWEEAVAWYGKGLRRAANEPANPGCWSSLLLVKARMGDRAGAEDMLAERWTDVQSGPAYSRRLAGSWDRLFAIAEALFVLGRYEEAARFHAALSAFSEHSGRPADHVLAMTAASRGDWNEAERRFQAAVDLAERLPNRIAQADARRDWSLALLRRGELGDRERATTLLREAVDLYKDMGMARHLETARAMIAAA